MMKLLMIFFWLPQVGIAQLTKNNAAPLHRAQKALTDVIIHDIFAPPVASRVYAYTNMAAYELLAIGSSHKTLYGQVSTFPAIPARPAGINTSLAAVYAFLITGKSLVFSEQMLQDSTDKILQWYRQQNIPAKVFQASLNYGQQVADTVLSWAGRDQYKETRSLRRYRFLKEEGKWMPTPPVYMAAIEPYWNRIRPILLDSCSQFKPAPALPFSTAKESAFYQQAIEVYNTTKTSTDLQKLEAGFWDCNPFAVATEGHLNYAIKKISPGGHWMSIAGLASRNKNFDMLQSAAVYALTSMALFDGFIICWDEKYRSNVIRPETFINKYIDEAWRPLLQTPPFPEYSSGHSVISTAAAVVLTHIFGDNFAFDDDTEMEFGLPSKHFQSFTAACNEAALSRLYGGIHYRAAIVNGQQQGRELGHWILRKICL